MSDNTPPQSELEKAIKEADWKLQDCVDYTDGTLVMGFRQIQLLSAAAKLSIELRKELDEWINRAKNYNDTLLDVEKQSLAKDALIEKLAEALDKHSITFCNDTECEFGKEHHPECSYSIVKQVLQLAREQGYPKSDDSSKPFGCVYHEEQKPGGD